MFGITASSKLYNEIDIDSRAIIRMDAMHSITRNKMTTVLEDMYNPNGWSSKTSQILHMIKPAIEVPYTPLPDSLITRLRSYNQYEEVEAKLLLAGVQFARSYYGAMYFNRTEGFNRDISAAEVANEILRPYREQHGVYTLFDQETIRARDILLTGLRTQRNVVFYNNTLTLE